MSEPIKPLGDTIRSVSWEELPPSVRTIPDNFDPLAEGVLMKHQREWVSIKAKIKLCAKGRRTGITFAEALEKVEISMMDEFLFSCVESDYKKQVYGFMLEPFE